MKRILFFCLVSISCSGNTNHKVSLNVNSYQVVNQSNPDIAVMEGIQEKINQMFGQAFMTQKPDAMEDLSNDLKELYKDYKQNLIQYWRAYLQFYKSIYYLKNGDKKNAEKEIDQGIEWLKGIQGKNSEDYALLSLLQGFSLQFKGFRVMFISSEVKENAELAITLDSMNLRGYYTFASNDYYTPEKYGGGLKAENFLLKAIALPNQSIANRYSPSWGKQEAYEMLINLYIKREQWEQAKTYFQQAIAKYPDNYQINRIAAKLVGK